MKSTHFPGANKVRLTADDLSQYSLSKDAAKALMKADLRVVEELIEREVTAGMW